MNCSFSGLAAYNIACVTYHEDLPHDSRVHPTLCPHNVQLTQLPPVGRQCTGLLDRVRPEQPM